MSRNLTQRQLEILQFIHEQSQENGYWPSIREMQQHFGFASTNAVMGHLRALERKRVISRIHGQARTFKITDRSYLPEAEPENAIDVVDIPIYGHIAAGYPDGVEPAGEIGRLQVDVHTANTRRTSKPFALKVRGDSMIDAGIFEGDIVILERKEPRDHDIVAALIDGETTLKRFIQRRSEPPYLKAENPNYPELFPVTDLQIQGVGKAVVRSL